MTSRIFARVLGTLVAFIVVLVFFGAVGLLVGVPVNWAAWQLVDALPYWANAALAAFLMVGSVVLYLACRDR